jgi:peptidoglycan/LPS O-acetylase OafA/YrhL
MKLPYRREVDGLRAIAVISIILFHAGFKTFEGGYVGVDIFFVISGFLITSIIVHDCQRDAFSFLAFYERRIRRLLPALFFVLLVSLGFAWAWMLPGELGEFSKSLLSVLAFSSNFFFWSDSGYFSTSAEFRPLLHTWSLAVEEQFYLLFPAILVMTHRWTKSVAVSALIFLCASSFCFSLWASTYKPQLAFFLLPARIWEFLIGALAALLVLSQSYTQLKRNRLFCQIASIGGLFCILYSIFYFKKTYIYPGYWAVIPVCGSALLLIFATESTLVNRLLSAKPLVSIGLISYSAYLWHQPLFAFFRLRELDVLSVELVWTLVFLSFGLGYLTWRFIEPLWRFGVAKSTIFTLPKRSFWWFLALCSLTFVIFFQVVKHSGGYRFRFNHLPANYFQTSWINYKFYGLNNQRCYTEVMRPCALASFPDTNINMLMVGDSHTGDFGGAFTEYLNANHINGSMFSVIGCGYLSQRKDRPSNVRCGQSRALLLDLAHKRTFSTYLLVSAGEVHTAPDAREFETLVYELLSTGAEVILFEPRMRLKYDPKKAGVLQQNSKNSIVSYDPSFNKDWGVALSKLLTHENFKIFDQATVLLDAGCGAADCFKGHTLDGHLIYRDQTHLTDFGAQTVLKHFDTWYQQFTKAKD